MGQAPRGSDRPGAGEPCRLRRSNRIARRERTMDDDTQASKRLYRVDKFLVPDEAREEYLQNLRATHELLRKQPGFVRSEEHTSELQSLMRISYAVFCLKKKKKNKQHTQ